MDQLQDSHHRMRAAAAVIVAITAFGAGCEDASLQAPPEIPRAEAEFERVTQRLESALKDAQAAAGSGIASNRECSYRLIPPKGDQGQYEAEIKIETTTRLLKPKLPVRKPPADSEIDSPEEVATAAQEVDRPAGPTPREVAEKEAAQIAALSKTRTVETYRLTFENDRWQLANSPEEPLDRIILEYALQD
jgi:hypothetical protein